MELKFNYKQKFSYSYFFPAILFIGFAFFCKVQNFGIAFKNLTLLVYPNSFYILSLVAVLFVAYALYKYLNNQKSNNNPNPILMTELGFSFPKGSSENIFVNYADVNELWNKEDSDDGEQIIIYTKQNNDRFEYSADNFDSKREFDQFKDNLSKYCTNLQSKE